MMDIQKEKEAFEQEFQKTSFYKNMIKSLENSDCPFTSVFEMRNGKYRSSYIQLSFEMWQAAKASAVPEGLVVSFKQISELVVAVNKVDLMTHTEQKTNEVRLAWQDIASKLQALIEAQEQVG